MEFAPSAPARPGEPRFKFHVRTTDLLLQAAPPAASETPARFGSCRGRDGRPAISLASIGSPSSVVTMPTMSGSMRCSASCSGIMPCSWAVAEVMTAKSAVLIAIRSPVRMQAAAFLAPLTRNLRASWKLSQSTICPGFVRLGSPRRGGQHQGDLACGTTVTRL